MKQILTTSLVTMGLFFTSFYAEAKKTETITCYLSPKGLNSYGEHIGLTPHKIGNAGFALIMQTSVAQSLIDNSYNTKGPDVEPKCSKFETHFDTNIQLCAVDDGNVEGVYHITIKMKDAVGVSEKTISLFKSRKELKTNYLTNLDNFTENEEPFLHAPRYFQVAGDLIKQKYPEYEFENLDEEDKLFLVSLISGYPEFNRELLKMGLKKESILMIDAEPRNLLCKLN